LSNFIIFATVAQEGLNTLPRYSKSSKSLIQHVKDNTQAEVDKLTLATKPIYYAHLKSTQKYQLERIKNGAYFESDSLLQLVNKVAGRIIEANQLDVAHPLFLIGHEPYAQALTYMNGVFEVSIGLLSILQNEDQLAFILSHELVHHIKYHVADAVYEAHESNLEKTIINEVTRIRNGNGSLEGLKEMQEKSYQLFKFSRSNEVMSDTLGIVYMAAAGYDKIEAQKILRSIGYRYMASNNSIESLLDQLFRKQYPLRSFWLDKGLNIYTRKPDVFFVFDTDSISTHPDMDIRIQKLMNITGQSNCEPLNLHRIDNILLAKHVIDGAYSSKQYDVCLYLSLLLLSQNPSHGHNDNFLVSTICKVFLGLYQAKYENTLSNNFSMYVNRFTVDYTEDLRQINSFLHNLTLEEMVEIGYQFLNKPANFDMDNEEDYWLLYRFSTLSKRESVAKRIKYSYQEKFPSGRYLKEFR